MSARRAGVGGSSSPRGRLTREERFLSREHQVIRAQYRQRGATAQETVGASMVRASSTCNLPRPKKAAGHSAVLSVVIEELVCYAANAMQNGPSAKRLSRKSVRSKSMGR